MSGRGVTRKTVTEHEIALERAMVTRHYVMTWDLDRCVGCQMGTQVCPKEAIAHTGGAIEDGRLVEKLLVDVDPARCVMCGMCEVVCPTSAIKLTINGERENPVLTAGAFPELIHSTTFDRAELFDRRRDPDELHDISADHPERVRRYHAEALERADRLSGPVAPPASRKTRRLRERLEALGYIE